MHAYYFVSVPVLIGDKLKVLRSRSEGEKGSALALVLIFVTVFSVMAGGSLMIVQSGSSQVLSAQSANDKASVASYATANLLGQIENSGSLTTGAANAANCGLQGSTFTLGGIDYSASCDPATDSGKTTALDALVLTGTNSATTSTITNASATTQNLGGGSYSVTFTVPSTAGLHAGDTVTINAGVGSTCNGTFTIATIVNSTQFTVTSTKICTTSTATITYSTTMGLTTSWTITGTGSKGKIGINYNKQGYLRSGMTARGKVDIRNSKGSHEYINVKNESGYWGGTGSQLSLPYDSSERKSYGEVKVPAGQSCSSATMATNSNCMPNAPDLNIATSNPTYWAQLQKAVETDNSRMARISGTDPQFDCTKWTSSPGIIHLKSGYYDYSALVALNNLTSNFTVNNAGQSVLTPMFGSTNCPTEAAYEIQVEPGTMLLNFADFSRQAAPSPLTIASTRWVIGKDTATGKSFTVHGNPLTNGVDDKGTGCVYPATTLRLTDNQLKLTPNGTQWQFAGDSSIENQGNFNTCPINYQNQVRLSMVALATSETTALTINTLSPTQGPVTGGTTITVTGSGFTSATQVSIGGSLATNVKLSGCTNGICTGLTATTGSHVSAANQDLTITDTGHTATFNSAYSYVSTFSSMTPSQGPAIGGNTVTLNGTGFNSATTVTVDGVTLNNAASNVVATTTKITFIMPPHPASKTAVTIQVNTNGQSYSLVNSYTFVPAITSVTPNIGPVTGGTVIKIAGYGFNAAGNAPAVYLSCTTSACLAKNIVVNADGSITATTPAASASVTPVSVIVTNTDGQSTTFSSAFTYSPAITSIVSGVGKLAGGDKVTINGSGFSTGASVKFGSQSATSVTYVNSTTYTAVTPAGLNASTVDVTITFPAASWGVAAQSTTFQSGFTYLAATAPTGTATPATSTSTTPSTNTNTTPTATTTSNTPTLTLLSSISGLTTGLTSITLTGSRFDSGAVVKFGTTSAATTWTNSTTLTATIPATSNPGAVSVTVTDRGLTTSALTYTYYSPLTLGTILNSGTSTKFLWAGGGNTVTINGTGFDATTAVTIGGAITPVTLVSATQIQVTTPAHTPGSVDVVVTSNGQTSTATSALTYMQSIRTVTNGFGLTTGGDSVTITGVGFGTTLGSISATLGGSPATVTSVSSSGSNPAVSTLVIKTPSHAAGTVDLVVTVNGQTVTFPSAYTYQAFVINSVSLSSSWFSTTVTVNGAGFTTTPSVTLGGQAGTAVTRSSSSTTKITFTAPTSTKTTSPADLILTQSGVSVTFTAALNFSKSTWSLGSTNGINTVTNTNSNPVTGALHAASTSNSLNLTTATPTASTSASAPTFGSAVTLSGTLPLFATGSVNFVAGGVTLCTDSSITFGSFSCSWTPAAAATYSVTAVYSGNAFYNTGTSSAVTVTVAKATPALGTIVFSPTSATYGSTSTATIANPTSTTAGAWTYSSATPTVASIANTVTGATLTVLAAGSTSITATFTPTSSNYATTTTTATFTVAKVTTTATALTSASAPTFGSAVTLSGTVPAGATGSVNFVAGGVTLCTATISAGAYSCSWTPAAAATYSVTAVYAGDTNYNTATSPAVTVTVAKVTTTATIVASATLVSAGSAVTLSGTVPTGATGSVNFMDSNGNILCTDSSITSGAYSCSWTPAAAATYFVTAVYTGDSNYATSTSSAVTVTVSANLLSITSSTGKASGGDVVTITGSGFVSGATLVSIGGVAATNVKVNSSTSLTATTGAHDASSVPVDLVVTVNNLPVTFYSAFTYVPTVATVISGSGPIAGGTTVTIAGDGFIAGQTVVKFGTLSGTNVNVTSSTSLTVLTPASAAGTVDVSVVVNGATGTFVGGYTYVAPITFTSISSPNGLTTGGDTIVITGSGFISGKSSITVDGIAAATPTINSTGTTLTFVTPAHAATTTAVDVVVTVSGFSATWKSVFTYFAPVAVVNNVGFGSPTSTNNPTVATGSFTFSQGGTTPAIAPAQALSGLARSATTAGEVFVSTGSSGTPVSDGSFGYAFISGLIFSPAGSFSFLNASDKNTHLNDGAMVQSLNIQGASTTSTVPIQITPASYAGNRHVYITVRNTSTNSVVARIEAVILDNHGWSPASGFQILSVSYPGS